MQYKPYYAGSHLMISSKEGWGITWSWHPSEIIMYVLRNHCTKFGALVRSVAIKTIRHQTIIE